VCIDNTNPAKHKREEYVRLANELKVPVRALYFNVEKPICLKNNKMRQDNPYRKHLSEKVPKIAIHMYFKNLEVPEMNEGFTDIVTIGFVESFENEKDEETYKTFLS
jgi:predicted kinase